MSFLNGNMPPLRCYLRKEFLFNLESHFDEFEECYIFGVSSFPGHALGFHILLPNGSQFHSLPIHAFVHKLDAPKLPLDFCQLWNCFSYDIAVTQYRILGSMRCRMARKDGLWEYGQYLCTFDWCHASPEYIDTSFSEVPIERKCAHLLQLDNGCFAAQPNNRIQWFDPYFITRPMGDEHPGYRINTHVWNAEDNPKWRTVDDDNYFYAMVHTDGSEVSNAKQFRSDAPLGASEKSDRACDEKK